MAILKRNVRVGGGVTRATKRVRTSEAETIDYSANPSMPGSGNELRTAYDSMIALINGDATNRATMLAAADRLLLDYKSAKYIKALVCAIFGGDSKARYKLLLKVELEFSRFKKRRSQEILAKPGFVDPKWGGRVPLINARTFRTNIALKPGSHKS